MPLKFKGAWRFDSPGSVPAGLVDECFELIGKIAQGDRQKFLEHFKTYFANAAGKTSSWSSNESWAATDLVHEMEEAGANAPFLLYCVA